VKVFRSFLLAGSLAALVAVDGGTAAVAQSDRALTIGMSTTVTALDPHEESNSPNNATSRHIFSSIVQRDGESQIRPELATSWRVIDDTHWEFTLRDDVKFHDGSTFDSEDVAVSLLRVRDMPSGTFASYTRNIKNVTAPEPYKVIVETETPDPLLLNSLSRLRIISADYASATEADFESGKAAVGTGPFKFVSYLPGDRLELVRNDQYFAGPVDWSHLTLRMIPDAGARLAALLAGDLDVIEAVPAEGIARIEQSDKLQLVRGQSTRLVYLSMDQHNKVATDIFDKEGNPLPANPLLDQRVRKALLMAINREAIVSRVMQGNGVVAHQFVGEGYFGHSEKVEKVSYDPEGAKKLLDEAGYPDGFRMKLHGPSGRYVNDSEVLQAVGQMFSRIGVESSVEVFPWSMYTGRFGEGEFSFYLGSWGVNTGEVSNPAGALVATKDAERGTGRVNGGFVSDKELDSALLTAMGTLDDGKREALLRTVSEITFNNNYLIPLHYEAVVLGAREGLQLKARGDKYTLAFEIKAAD
jgi:peptide/nickel transport system substrate-binding protein